MNDQDFGEFDILKQDYKVRKIRITNNSEDTELIISDFVESDPSTFESDLPEISSDNPLVIQSSDFFEFNVTFKPNEVRSYKDSIMFVSNAIGTDSIAYLTGEGIDTNDTHVEYSTETDNYLFFYEPYPNPAVTETKALIYWDTSLEINEAEVTIADVSGREMSSPDKVRIEKLNAYSGYLIWNCSDVPTGIYLIKLTHGTKSRTLKVVVKK